MKRFVLVGAIVAAAAAMAPMAHAQDAKWDVGVYGRINWLDGAYNAETGAGLGARVGYLFNPWLEVQGDFSYSHNSEKTTTGYVNYLPIHLRAVVNYPTDKDWGFFFGAGYTYSQNYGAVSGSTSGYGGMIGARYNLKGNVWGFVDYTMDNSDKPTSSAWNKGLELGISWMLPKKKEMKAAAPAPAPAAVAAAPVAAAAVVVAPADDDKDGVINTLDKCPMTPAGEAVDVNGCSQSQKDDDHDGVMNTMDKCPMTPAGEAVDANGCSASQKDDDHDGVMNNKDMCPNTPAGTAVDASGCAPLVLKGVNFETNKAVLLAGSAATLDQVATGLTTHPNVKVEIQGYTDNVGDAAYNTKLSQSRANAVMAYLVSKGVAADRITAKGYGPADPMVPNTSKENKAQNRRVQVKIVSE